VSAFSPSPTTTSPPAGAAVYAQRLAKRFGRVLAVRDVSFVVPERCVCGLLGPNGAGKSTTIRMLAGLLVPDEGELRVAGFDLRCDANAARRVTGYLPESAPIHPELRTREFLAYRGGLIGLSGAALASSIERVVQACSLQPVWGRLVGALSKGYRQRVGLAAAILGDPRLVILDEPSVGLDPHQLLEFRRLIRDLSRERAVLLSSHILAEVEATCDRAVLMSQGSLVAEGSMDELRSRGRVRYVIEARGDAVRSAIASIPGLGSVREQRLDGEWRRVEADSADATDLREAIAIALERLGVPVRELRRDRASLESLFVKATGAREADAA